MAFIAASVVGRRSSGGSTHHQGTAVALVQSMRSAFGKRVRDRRSTQSERAVGTEDAIFE